MLWLQDGVERLEEMSDNGPADAAAATSLAAALCDDAFYAFVSAPCGGATRMDALRRYMVASMAEGRVLGRVVSCDDGAAIWTLPGPARGEAVSGAATAAKRTALLDALSPAGLARFDDVVRCMELVAAKHDVLQRAWYLSILGVSPGKQRSGVASRLLRPTLEEADVAGADCWLETYGAETLPFYSRLGFEPLIDAPVREPNIGADYWILLRKAPAATQA